MLWHLRLVRGLPLAVRDGVLAARWVQRGPRRRLSRAARPERRRHGLRAAEQPAGEAGLLPLLPPGGGFGRPHADAHGVQRGRSASQEVQRGLRGGIQHPEEHERLQRASAARPVGALAAAARGVPAGPVLGVVCDVRAGVQLLHGQEGHGDCVEGKVQRHAVGSQLVRRTGPGRAGGTVRELRIRGGTGTGNGPADEQRRRNFCGKKEAGRNLSSGHVHEVFLDY
mmetsp:Transcript_27714/g.69904  ORF Transcript_27714/g.69904 Transcript_27714/m.69904 type:complete len:226 (+) Transcript_27714:416-1093(+)